MIVVMTGAGGLIGRPLSRALATEGHTLRILSRAGADGSTAWNPASGEPPEHVFEGAAAVIHLAGEPVAQRWTREAKARIRDSRVLGTRNLVRVLRRLAQPPAALICASAIGYYGERGDEVLNESAIPGTGYLAEVCLEWEQEAREAEAAGIRVVRLRTGVALSEAGGALARMLPAYRTGLGGPLGGGRQWMSWIHLADLVELFCFAMNQPISGAVNAVAPGALTNHDFSRELGHILHRPALFPVPRLALKTVFGEMAEVLTSSQRVVPSVALEAGFRFRFPALAGALGDLLEPPPLASWGRSV
jgi:uncharacterized protein